MKKIINILKKIELNYSILSCLLILITIHFVSAGYSSFNSSIRINDLSAKVRAESIIRVTDFKVKEASNNAISYYEEFDINMLYTRVKLPTLDSYIIYDVEVANYGLAEAGILDILLNDDYFSYEITNYTMQDIICDNTDITKCTQGAKKTFQLKIKYNDDIIEPLDTVELSLDVLFETVVNVSYYGIDSTNLKNKVLLGGNYTETLNIPEENLKVILGGWEISLNVDDNATYINGVLNINEVYGFVSIYNYIPLEIKTSEEYKPDKNDDINFTYEITNKNSFDVTYRMYPMNGNLSEYESIYETIKGNSTETKNHKLKVEVYGESNLRYIEISPFYREDIIKIKVKDRKVKYLKVDRQFPEPDNYFMGGPIKRKEIESISFLGVTSIPETALGQFDVSYIEDGKTTWAWYFDNDNNGLYEVYISYFGEVDSGERVVYLKSGDNLFACMNNLKEINYFDENGINRFNTDECDSLFRLFFRNTGIKNIDISHYNTSNNTSLYETFNGCSNVEEINLGNMDTSQVTIMWRVFCDCSKLKSINVTTFDTSNTINMGDMFRNCRNITELDLSSFNTYKVQVFSSFLRGCTNLSKVDLSHFDTSSVNDYSSMLYQTPHISTTITIKSDDFSYTSTPFYLTATDAEAKIIVNYTAQNKEKVEEMVNSKTATSNVVLGEQVI